ncbi:signal peptidase I, partial [Streptomyces chryseus]
MDTEAHDTERDRSSVPPPGDEEGARSVRFSAAAWRRPALLGGACAAFLLLFSTFVLQPFLIPSGSMQPTADIGDRVLVNKLAYRFGSVPQRGDVVVFDGTGSFVREEPERNPVTGLLRWAAAAVGLAEPAETDYIKRVVGVGG